MRIRRTQWSALAVVAALSAGSAFAAEGTDVSAEIQALKTRIAELEKKENENWLTAERSSQIKTLVTEVIEDARKRGQSANGDLQAGYKDGFFLQSANQDFKLVVGGFMQFRYNYVQHHASHTGGPSGTNTAPFAQGNQENANGFDIRRARVSFSGNAFTKDITFKLEGDFYGGQDIDSASANSSSGNVTSIRTRTSSGNFTVTDAYLGYRFTDLLKLKAGAFKVPFTKVDLMSDTTLGLMERPEVQTPFDAQRSIGMSLYGDIVKDQVTYDVNVNNGSNSNIFRRVDTPSSATSSSTAAYNLDNRLGYYARMNWAGSGTVSDFMGSESDLRKDNSAFIWMLGGAGGYESQNGSNGTFTQNTASVAGLGTNDHPGYTSNYTLNGDLYRGTIDFSAKYQGWAFNTAAYFQQINANPVAGTTSTGLPYGTGKASFFAHGYYGQVGYMVMPKLELVTRAGVLLEEGDPNIGEFYTVGANYYLYGNNAKISADVTYTPEAPFTDGGATLIQNAHEVAFRLQLQLKF